jgi:SNF2 family DNA or RNA helicase
VYVNANYSIALLVSRPSDDEDRRTTLICTPVALLRQWYNELRTKTDPPLNVYIHHTSSRGRRARTGADLLNYDIVLTTYNTLVALSQVFLTIGRRVESTR